MLSLFARAPMWAIRSIQERGLGKTVAIATSFLADYTFDLKYGTDTNGQAFPTYSDASTDGFAHYQACKAAPFMAMMESLDPPVNSVFVDVGCGKGKPLLIAGHMTRGGVPRFK